MKIQHGHNSNRDQGLGWRRIGKPPLLSVEEAPKETKNEGIS